MKHPPIRLITLAMFFIGLVSSLQAQVTANFSGNPTSGCSPLVVQFTDLSTGPVTSWFWDFGNGNTSTLQNPAAVYVTPGTYTVTLTVSDGVGNDTEVRNAYITVFQNPTANFVNATPRSGCAPLTVCFTDLSTPGDGAINGWLWDFGDGTNSTLQHPCHTFSAPGTYTISLVATDVNGCNSSIVQTNYVSVSNVPTASFSGSPLSACDPPLTVNFTNNSSGGAAPLSYQWDFGDGGSSTLQNPSHTYTSFGSFNVTLITTDANGCADTTVLNAYVNINNITAAFTPSTTNICEGQSVSFTNTSSPGATSWQWSFGDGNTSNAQNPTHAYATAGTYTVTLIASNGLCADTVTQTNLITVDPAPAANFVADTTSSCAAPFTVNFTDLSTGGPVAWLWDFGDGNTSTLQNPSHTYAAPGTYTVTLTATGPNGCPNTFTIPNYIQIVEPVADFVGAPLFGCIPLNVNFTDLSTSNEPIVSWFWNFGDGNTSTLQNPSNIYTVPGSYTVSLIIVNAAGCTDTIIRPNYVNVGDVPIACFSNTPDSACVNDPISFTDCSTNATGWFWTFGDGGTSTLQNPTYAYQDTGCFTVTLVVSNFGCTDDTVIVDAVCISPPLAQFTLNPNVGCAVPHFVTFTDQSILPHTWNWDFGDGNTSTLQNPTHTYTTPGSFTVTLTVQDTVSGCTDDAQAQVNISLVTAGFTANILLGCGPLTVNFTDLSTSTTALTNWLWDFGDGNTSNAQNPTHTYQNPGTYTVTLTVTDANGCTQTAIQSNYVQVIGPDVDFVADTLAGCDSLFVQFTDQTVPGAPITGWLWDFGDGNTSTLQNPSHTYFASGTYTVSLTVTDTDGCSRTFTRNNYISVTSPIAAFTVDDSLTCAGVALNFNDNSVGTGLNYLWDFGNGTTSTATNPSHSYTTNGTYNVSLLVTDVNGCQDSITIPGLVDIQDVLADFGAAPTNASCPPLLVVFSDSSQYDIVGWDWDFGDGTGSVLQNPSHVYTQPGSYDVTLAVVNDDGCRDTLFVPGLINIQGPSGSFSFAPDSGCTPQLVNFNATATNTAIYTWDFGDGNVAITTVDSVDHVYTQTGVFFPILILDDGNGCTFSILSPDSIVIDTIPFVNFAVNSSVLCGLDSVYFTDLTVSTRPITSWYWDFGDGSTDSVQNPVHFYSAPGNYTVTLGVVNSLGCTDTISLPANISVFFPPTAAFNVSDSIGCDPLTVNFTDASTGAQPITGWAWDFGDGNSSALQNPVNTYLNPGTFSANLIVTDSAGCRDTVARPIVVSPGPTASFIADDTVGCPPHPVTFTAAANPGIVSFQWNFGDGNTGTGNPVTHTYTSSGNYTVTLIVTDTLGCQDSLVRPQYIEINPPVADFTQNATSGCPPLTVTFTDNSTSSNPIVAWDWDFGDGSSGTGTPVTHTYATPGTYTVTLIVTDDQGCRDTIVRPNLITVFTPPTANFGVVDTVACLPFTIELGDSSVAGSVAITTWDWDFGDGGSSTLQNPIHAYATPGPFNISLIVTDANGCRDTSVLPFVVPPPPLANFSATDSIGCPPMATTFNADTSGGLVFFEWNFGDGSPAAFGTPVSHTYTLSGNYTVTLIVEDANGCRDTLTRPNYIQINPPSADFTQNVTSGCPPLAVTFTDNSTFTNNVVAWDWDFGDGTTGTGTPVAHTYANPGVYTVTLIITDSIGCSDTIVKPNLITVFAPPAALFGITDTLSCSPFTIQLTDSSSGSAAVTGWNWDFGDGTTSTLQHPIHGYTVPGPYTISLIVTDANGCQDTFALPFDVPVRPQANFTASDSVGCAPFAVIFTADSVDVLSYFWDFGDGSTSTVGPVVSHTYLNTGAYAVILIIGDIYGCFDTLRRPDYIFVDSLAADFNQSVSTGCLPISVTFTDLSYSDTTIVSWFWDFGDGFTTSLQNPTHTYTAGGTYVVTLTVTNAIGCTDTVQGPVIQIFDQFPPSVPPILMATVESDVNDSISWRAYTGSDFSHYVLYRENPTSSNNWLPIDSIFNALDTTYRDFPLATLSNSYCYKLQVVDLCGLRSSLDSSGKHCTINLEATAGIDQAILTWSAYVGWDSVLAYDVYRVANYDTSAVQYLGTVPGGVTTFVDSVVTCYEDYCYRVRAWEMGGFFETAWSDTSCASPIHEPNVIPMHICAASVLNDTFVEIQWDAPPSSIPMTLFLEKSENGQSWTQIAVLPPTILSYTDFDVDVHEQSYYYRISFVDSCGDASPWSNLGRTVLLVAENQSQVPTLDWNAYEQWASGVLNYEIEVFSDLGQAWQPVTTVGADPTRFGDVLTFLDQPFYCYRVFANENGGACRSLSNVDCVPVGPRLFAPNAFTPNGDFINDFFVLKGIYIADYDLLIFDRWGALIYESFSLEDHWDGTWRGKPCQEGVYVWVVRARGFDGTEIERRGTVTLIR